MNRSPRGWQNQRANAPQRGWPVGLRARERQRWPQFERSYWLAGDVPTLDLKFAENRSLVDAISGQSPITFSRASSGTYFDRDGILKTAPAGVPRFDHNPITGECLGLLIEEGRTNLLLNSAALGSQSASVTAQAYTLSFYGTGTITLSGTSTAGPLVGTGAASRVSLTFTPTAGSLTMTVSGSATNAQLEAGSFATSYIPTTTAAASRSADVVSITGANFTPWYRQDAQTWFVEYAPNYTASATVPPNAPHALQVYTSVSVNNNYAIRGAEANISQLVVARNPTVGVQFPSVNMGYGQAFVSRKVVYSIDSTVLAMSANASNVTQIVNNAAALMAPHDALLIGSGTGGSPPYQLNGTIRSFTYWPVRLPNSVLQLLTR